MLSGYKTYILGGLGIVGLLAHYLVGDVGLADAIQQAVPILMGMTIRHGVATALK